MHAFDGATTDFVTFRAERHSVGLLGTVDAATLAPTKVVRPELSGGNYLALRPILDT